MTSNFRAQPIQQPFQVPLRDPADFNGTVRWTDWSGGYDLQLLQLAYGYLYVSPRYYDGQNIDGYSLPGTFRLCSKWHRIGDLESDDHEYLFIGFGSKIYRFPTANFNAALVQHLATPTVTPAWADNANAYPGATATRNGVIWRDMLVLATRETSLRTMTTGEVFSTIAQPASVAGSLAGQVGVGQDDRLLVWWEGFGLYAYDGTNWTRIFPALSVSTPAQPYCDMILRATGSTLFATRDSSGSSTLFEYAVEPTGTFLNGWLQQAGMRFFPQGGEVYGDTAWFVARLGASRNVGVIYSKAYRQAPNDEAYLDTNFATANQRGLDWAWRCLFSTGDSLLAGGSSRYDHNATIYVIQTDEDGTLVHPNAVMAKPAPDAYAIPGPIYSIVTLPTGGDAAASSGRIFASAQKSTWYKEPDGEGDPTSDDAEIGFIQNSGADLGMPDHLKVAGLGSINLLDISDDGIVSYQWRADPTDPTVSWTELMVAGGVGETSVNFPSDDASAGEYGTAARVIETRVVITRPTLGTTRDTVDTMSLLFTRAIPLAEPA